MHQPSSKKIVFNKFYCTSHEHFLVFGSRKILKVKLIYQLSN